MTACQLGVAAPCLSPASEQGIFWALGKKSKFKIWSPVPTECYMLLHHHEVKNPNSNHQQLGDCLYNELWFIPRVKRSMGVVKLDAAELSSATYSARWLHRWDWGIRVRGPVWVQGDSLTLGLGQNELYWWQSSSPTKLWEAELGNCEGLDWQNQSWWWRR